MKTSIALVAFMLSVGAQAGAQTFHWPAATAPIPAGAMSYFPAGTPLVLTTRTQVSTKDNHPGDRLYLEVAQPLLYHGQVVIPAGSPVVAEVQRMQRNGHFGKKGKLYVQILYAETPSGPVRLSGWTSDEGTSGTAASIGTMLIVSPLGALIHGTSANIMPGTVVQAHLAEDLRFFPQAPAQQVSMRQVAPDGFAMASEAAPQALPARFDPRAFGGAQQTAQR